MTQTLFYLLDSFSKPTKVMQVPSLSNENLANKLRTCYNIEKDVFHLVMSMRKRRNCETPIGIKPQTFSFHALMLYH